LILHRLLLVEVGQQESDGGQTDGRTAVNALPQAGVEVGWLRAGTEFHQQGVSPGW